MVASQPINGGFAADKMALSPAGHLPHEAHLSLRSSYFIGCKATIYRILVC
jgi:hypothetical protein